VSAIGTGPGPAASTEAEAIPSGASPLPPSILVIDDEPHLLRYFEYNLRSLGYSVRTGRSLADLTARLEEEAFAVLLLDLMLPDGEALDHLPRLIERYPDLSVVLVSAHGTIPKAVHAIQLGAVNFIQKPVGPEALEGVLANAVQIWRLRRENENLRRQLEVVPEFYAMVGPSDAMQEVFRMIRSVAATLSPVLITGESGTGKELVARAVHACGPRARHPFIAINCAAIPRDLLESEMFGHEKGAFTGAIEQRRGCFERAHRGTLFLDEIAEMDLGLQVKLLRVIEEPSFFRIGGTEQVTVNVRVIAATNRDPLEMVRQGRFREDLYYRLSVLPIHLPPLRERREDIAPLARRFLREVARENAKSFETIELDALRTLEAHPWTGNVRELRNVIEQAVVLHRGPTLTREMLPDRIRAPRSEPASRPVGSATGGPEDSAAPLSPTTLKPFWQIERDELQRALDICRGNVQEVARRMEISPATLYRKIEKYGLVK